MAPPPEMTLAGVLLIAGLSAAAASISASARSSDLPTAYDVVERYDFPRGILPEGVQSYLLQSDGSFDVYLAGDCEFRVAGYTLWYSRKVSGRVRPGVVTELKGVSVRILFLWIGIDRVVLTDDRQQLKFFVGPLSASFAASSFDESPRCGCGFDCAAAAAVLVYGA